MTPRQAFLKHLCQTSPHPIGLAVDRAHGAYIHTREGKTYLDFISGIGVANLGHTPKTVVSAIRQQAGKYLHVMVYGEYLQAPQINLATALANLLPPPLSVVYFTNSGTEANEGAIKLAKKLTGRTRLIGFHGSFHGDSQGALSVTGREAYRQPFLPLLPEVSFLKFNRLSELKKIDDSVAAVITEPIQGEGGIRLPHDRFLPALQARCRQVGALLILDEAQTGFGRTGRLFAMDHWNIVPDILTLAKAMGAGMPIGAFVASPEIMKTLSEHPPFSHVTTFGGHPVSCAAALAGLKFMVKNKLPDQARVMGDKIQTALKRLAEKSSAIREIRGMGMMIGMEMQSAKACEQVVTTALQEGLILGWTLHTNRVIRISPPLTLSEEEMQYGMKIIAKALRGLRAR